MSTSWPEKNQLLICPHKHFSKLPKCKGTLLEELIKKITESTDSKLYCAYIILSICEDISDLLYVWSFSLCARVVTDLMTMPYLSF